MMQGMDYLQGAVDCHIHTCPHINGRSVNILDSIRQAAAAGMSAVGLMDNFQNSSGYAALAMAELGDLGVEVFGGLIMQPTAGGVSLEVAQCAVGYGYEFGVGAKFLSLPTHHTRYVALREGRSGAYLDAAFAVPEDGKVPDPVPAIMALCAERDIVFDCGHVSGPEAIALAHEAKKQGVTRLRTHCGGYEPEDIAELVKLGAYCEFSFFAISHATQVGLTHVDAEKHKIKGKTVQDYTPKIRAAGDKAIVSSDAGVFLLAPPVESFRQYMLLLESEGFSREELRRMNTENPNALFGLGRG